MPTALPWPRKAGAMARNGQSQAVQYHHQKHLDSWVVRERFHHACAGSFSSAAEHSPALGSTALHLGGLSCGFTSAPGCPSSTLTNRKPRRPQCQDRRCCFRIRSGVAVGMAGGPGAPARHRGHPSLGTDHAGRICRGVRSAGVFHDHQPRRWLLPSSWSV